MKYFIERYRGFFKLAILFLGAVPLILALDGLVGSVRNGSVTGVLACAFTLVPALYIFGMTASCLYSGAMARGVADFLLYPRNYLKEPPVVISRQKGLIANGEYQLAETELCEMRMARPAAPEVALLLAELHAVHFRSPETAVGDIVYYLSRRKLRHHPLNLTMMLRYADFQQELGEFAEAADLLKHESGRLLYTARERKVLAERSAALARRAV